MRFGVYAPTFGEYDVNTLAQLAREAEAAGWDGSFIWDHLAWTPDERQDLADTTVALTAIALTTERVRFGALVTPLARRRPWKLAKETATLDHPLSHRCVSPAPSPPELRRGSIALRGATGGLGQFQGAGGRRVDALVPVVPADSIAGMGVVAHNLLHHTAAGGAVGRLRLDEDVISRRESHDCPFVDFGSEGTSHGLHGRADVKRTTLRDG
jgi:hypothetical protein